MKVKHLIEGIIFMVLLISPLLNSAQEVLYFRYFPIPEKPCSCAFTEIEAYRNQILAALEEAVKQRKRLQPKREKNQTFPQQLGDQAKRMVLERTAIYKKANNRYLHKVEPLYLKLTLADKKHQARLKKKIGKAQKSYCLRYSKQQNQLIRNHLKQLSALKPWMEELITSEKDLAPDESSITVSDFDLYLLYLETVSKTYDYKLHPSERENSSED